MTDNRNKILGFMRHKLEWLRSLPEKTCRAELAELRRGIGHAPGDIPALWGTFLTDLPEEFYRNSGEASEAEWAVYIALTMFALHQQGHDFKSDWMHDDKIPFGRAVRKLAPVADDTNDDLKRIRNRFNKIATASDMRELTNHLRGMVNLLSSKDIKFDYADLAYDLYRYDFYENRSKVRLKWGQDFQTLVDAGISPERKITELTGITPEMLKSEGIPIKDALERLTVFVGSLPIMCHNVEFDCGFLMNESRRNGVRLFRNQCIDTLVLARRRIKGVNQYTLAALCEHFGINASGAHRALTDCRLTMMVFEKLNET